MPSKHIYYKRDCHSRFVFVGVVGFLGASISRPSKIRIFQIHLKAYDGTYQTKALAEENPNICLKGKYFGLLAI